MNWKRLIELIDDEEMQEWKVYEYRYIGPWTDAIKSIHGKKEIPLYYRGITEMSLSARHNNHGSDCRKILSEKQWSGDNNIFHRTFIASGGTHDSSENKLWDLRVVNRFFYYYRGAPKFSLKYISEKEQAHKGPLNTYSSPDLNSYPFDSVFDEKSELEYVQRQLDIEKLSLTPAKQNRKNPSKIINYMHVYPVTNPTNKKWYSRLNNKHLGCYYTQEGAALAAARLKAKK